MNAKKRTQTKQKQSRSPTRLLPPPGARTTELRKAIRQDIVKRRRNAPPKLNTPIRPTYRKGNANRSRNGRGNRKRFPGHIKIDWVGPYGNSSNSSADHSGTAVNYLDEDGQLAATSHIAKSLAEYERTDSEPLTYGTTIEGVKATEYRYTDRGVAGVVIKGRTFIGDLNLAALQKASEGDRLIPPIVLSPRAIGGRAAYFADLYHNCRILRAKLLYRTTSPTDREGAILIQYRADDSMRHSDLGIKAMIRAAASDNWVQTPVWKNVDLTIHPLDTMKTYFTEDSGDARLSVQGCIEVFAASAMIGGAADTTTLGNLYLEYEMEFQRQTLAPVLTTIMNGAMNFESPSITLAGWPVVYAVVFPTATTNMQISFDPLITGATDNPGNYIGECVIHSKDTWAGDARWTSFPDESDEYPYIGQVIYFRVFCRLALGGGGLVALFFDNLDSATQFTYDPNEGDHQAASPGQLLWSSQPPLPFSGTLTAKYRVWRLNADT
jgi:hypothetical protein